jgi:phenylalanyl-tRNA synthetase beta chain
MLLSYRWLCGILGTDPGLDKVRQVLTDMGIEVESVRDLGAGHGKIVAARILTKEGHPNADRLSLCDVDAGPDLGTKRIVCGAQNMVAGDMVPLALEGAVLPGNFVIKKSKIRGEASEGMMCSGRELGLGEDHSGLLLLPTEETDGGPYGQPLFPLGRGFEAILEVKPTPNRGDCLNMKGLVRELRSGLGLENSSPVLPELGLGIDPTQLQGQGASPVKVVVEDGEACPLYLGQVLRGVRIGPSPRWLQRVLEAAGLRSINNVVDVTNFILLESGQPMHAFDLQRIEGGRVVVRRAEAGETIRTLDGQDLSLMAEDLLIADGRQGLALAGVMGGEGSAISDSTTDLFLECAVFDPAVVRRTSRRLGKVTDSSQRFERGVDRSALHEVLGRAVALILATGGGRVDGARSEVAAPAPPAASVFFDPEAASRFLGGVVELEESRQLLTRLGFEVQIDGGQLKVVVPPHRHDIFRPVDLYEEVARVMGYGRFPSLPPTIRSRSFGVRGGALLARRIRQVFAGRGLHELCSLSFVSQEQLQKTGFGELGADSVIALRNPLSADHAFLRPSLVPGLLAAAEFNQNRGLQALRLFEVGRVFHPAVAVDGSLPAQESLQVAALLSGPVQDQGWRPSSRQADFYDLKGLLAGLGLELGLVSSCDPEVVDYPEMGLEMLVPDGLFHPGRRGAVRVGDRLVGAMGELHPALLAPAGLRRAPMLLVLDGDGLAAQMGGLPQVRPIGEFPSVTRDLGLLVPEDVASSAVEQVCQRKGRPLLQDVRLFDVYQGPGVEPGFRSLAYALEFSAPDRTLRDEEVAETIDKILSELSKIRVTLRGGAAA